MSIRESARPQSPHSGRGVTSPVTSHVASDATTGTTGGHPDSNIVRQTSLLTPHDDVVSLPRSVPTSFSFPGEAGGPSLSLSPSSFSSSSPFGRSVPRDDSGLSIASLGGRGRPSDSGYGTDSPASLNTMGALRFRFGSSAEGMDEGMMDAGLGEAAPYLGEAAPYLGEAAPYLGEAAPYLGGEAAPLGEDLLDFHLDLNDEDDDEDDDVFLDVVPEEEVDGDDEDAEPAFPRRPAAVNLLRRDVVDGGGRRNPHRQGGGGSDGQADTSTEEDDDTPSSSSGGSSSQPIAIPRPLHTDGLEYAVALAYTPPHHRASANLPAGSGGGAILLARGSLRQEGALWAMTQAQYQHSPMTRGHNALAYRRAALFTSTPCRNGLQRVQLEEPLRRFSDGVDPRLLTSGGRRASTSSPVRPGGAAASPGSAPLATCGGRRTQSESGAYLEQQLGQELRRISDEFHMSYQQSGSRLIPPRVLNSAAMPHSSSLPDRPRRGSLIDRFINIFSSTGAANHHDDDDDTPDDDDFRPRRRAHSEIFMASGVTAAMFGRQESLQSGGSYSGPSSPGEQLHPVWRSGREDPDEGLDDVDGGGSSTHDDTDDEHHPIFTLSTEQ